MEATAFAIFPKRRPRNPGNHLCCTDRRSRASRKSGGPPQVPVGRCRDTDHQDLRRGKMAVENVVNRTMNRNEWLMLLLLSVLWGGSFFFVGILVRSLPAFTIVFLC